MSRGSNGAAHARLVQKRVRHKSKRVSRQFKQGLQHNQVLDVRPYKVKEMFKHDWCASTSQAGGLRGRLTPPSVNPEVIEVLQNQVLSYQAQVAELEDALVRSNQQMAQLQQQQQQQDPVTAQMMAAGAGGLLPPSMMAQAGPQGSMGGGGQPSFPGQVTTGGYPGLHGQMPPPGMGQQPMMMGPPSMSGGAPPPSMGDLFSREDAGKSSTKMLN